ncbi:membrane-bound transcription factor site-2 protease homolog isoform X2 [Carex rostrata]
MAICRSRRRGGGRPLLPSTISFLPPNYLSLSSSFWYTDFKIYTFNHVLFRLGSAHSRFLKVWFSLGACFGLVALLILSIMLIWNLWGTVSFKGGAFLLDNFFSPGRSISFLDFVLLILSTLISIAFHEFGHAFAAASEGLQIEYIALFLAVLFPGALVALNQISLENLCPFASLRIYCAGIWHNIVVLNVPKYSSLSAHLSPLDLIVTVDGLRVTSTDDWFQVLTRNKSQNIHEKGYCVPISWVEAGDILMAGNRNGECPQDFSPFQTLSCANSSLVRSDKMESLRHCLIAKDVASLRKCGYTGNHCACSEEEMCMTPVEHPGMSWVEIFYQSPYTSRCEQLTSSLDPIANQDQNPCGLSFVYIGDASFVARSLTLSPYKPRWGLFISLSVYIPYLMEKALHSVFHVSLALAVVNCLPVYLLDGASILETILCYFTRLTQREKQLSLKVGLLVGTSLSIISCIRILFALYLVSYSRR